MGSREAAGCVRANFVLEISIRTDRYDKRKNLSGALFPGVDLYNGPSPAIGIRSLKYPIADCFHR